MDEVRRIRKEHGLSQQRLSKLAGVDKVTIVHIEGGKVSPKVETLEKLAGALNVEVGDFFPKAQPSLFSAGVKGPDPAVWGADSERPDPAAARPAPGGKLIQVEVTEADGDTHVTITETRLLDLFAKVARGELEPEEAAKKFAEAAA